MPKAIEFEVIWKDEGGEGPVWVAKVGTLAAGQLSKVHRVGTDLDWYSRKDAERAAKKMGAAFIAV